MPFSIEDVMVVGIHLLFKRNVLRNNMKNTKDFK